MSRYDDIIDHPRYRLKNHKPMSRRSRAAQFSPFAALTGYEDMISEEARQTGTKRELTDDEKEILNKTLYDLSNRPHEDIPVRLTYFAPDRLKSGGEYVEYEGTFRYFNAEKNCLVFRDGKEVYVDNIISIDELKVKLFHRG